MFKKFAGRGAVVAGLLAPLSSFAAVPAVVGTTLDTIQTDALAVIDLVWPVVLAVVGGFILLKVVKRGVNKI